MHAPSTPRIFTASVACYPLVRKFLTFHYSTAPFMIGARENNPYATYLTACLDRQAGFELPPSLLELTDTLQIGIAGWRDKGGTGRHLSPARVVSFNRFVRSAFMDRIVTELVMQQLRGKSVARSIQRILTRYDLKEEELSFDTVMRYYTRKRDTFLRELTYEA